MWLILLFLAAFNVDALAQQPADLKRTDDNVVEETKTVVEVHKIDFLKQKASDLALQRDIYQQKLDELNSQLADLDAQIAVFENLPIEKENVVDPLTP